MGTHSLAAYL
ncbi:hypothetical protein VCCP1047_3145, partial [Vibrio cholerae CP1047(20)]